MRVLLANINWSNTSPGWSVTTSQVMANDAHNWYAANSYGKLPMDFTVTPFFTIPVADTAATSTSWTNQADILLLAAGYNQNTYDRVVYVTPRTYAMGNFKGLCWGRQSWVNCGGSDYAPHATIHELGHSIGLPHPSKIYDIGTRSGNVTTLFPLSQNWGGRRVDLYDVWTTMGYEAKLSHFCAAEKTKVGWITPAIYDGTDRTYNLTPLEQQGGSLYAVKIPCSMFLGSSQRVYWLESRYRTDLAYSGIQLRISGDFGCTSQGWYDERAIGAGERITDGTINIDVINSTTVKVSKVGAINLPPNKPTNPLNVISITNI